MPFHGVAGCIGYNIGAAEVVGVNVKNISLLVFQFDYGKVNLVLFY